MKALFLKANIEIGKISEWFEAYKLNLNEDKTRFTFFHRLQGRDINLPLQLPVLEIKNHKSERSSSIKFLGIMVDEHLNWKDHINITENKLSKNYVFYTKKTIFKCKNNEKFYFCSFIAI